MPELIQRAYPRTDFDAPIKYAALNSNQFCRTWLLNYSEAGLCYETERQFEPETKVHVAMVNYRPGQIGPEGYRSYLTRIRWIRPLSGSQEGRFAVGAQIVTRSHEALDAGEQELRQHCDLCGVLIQVSRLQCTDGSAQLCEPCYKHFRSIPPGKIRQSVERFLLGNVV